MAIRPVGRLLVLAASLSLTAGVSQTEEQGLWGSRGDRMARMPNGRSQAQMILESNLKKNREDLQEMDQIAQELEDAVLAGSEDRKELEKKAERIEKLAKSVKSRLKWF